MPATPVPRHLAGEPLALPPGIVTGEAVLLELRLASPLTRALALALDVAILVAAGIAVIVVVAFAITDLDSAGTAAVGLATIVVLLVGVPTAWETASRGRSPGKAAAGLRVVRDDGGPVRLRHALVRALVGFGELWMLLGGPALLCALASPRGKRIGDLLAGTVVVRERTGQRAEPLVHTPPQLVAWVRGADVARLPDDLALVARTVLSRAARLDPASRARLLGEAAARVRPLVSPQPPPGTPDEALLAAVLAERRERDRAWLERARVRRDTMAEASRRLLEP